MIALVLTLKVGHRRLRPLVPIGLATAVGGLLLVLSLLFYLPMTLLAPLRETAHRFGGSHAQRDLIELTLLAACALPGGSRALGRALLNERALARGRTPQLAHWRERLGLAARD